MTDLPQQAPSAHLEIIVLNYRTPELTIDCLFSLVKEVQALAGTHVTVVDNASGDGSVEKIARAIATENWKDWVTFMPLEQNGGYAAGNNAAIRPILASPNPPPYI
ncbi:MAG: glycosyltransferase, partial [Leptolyngbyaceae cyanobacterium CRU_2_3]|nr:glycosyltransferase [Leptolyngbyaceae cyanobacterium CRU_2_3]